MSLVAYFCLEGVCTPRAFGSGPPSLGPVAAQPLVPGGAGKGYEAPYGTTTAVEMIGRGMVPTSAWVYNPNTKQS